MDILQEEGPRLGLILSTTASVPPPAKPKSTIWCPTPPERQEDPLGKGLLFVMEDSVILLGAPVGSLNFEARQIQRKVEKIQDTTALLPLLEDAHTEFVLLRSCLSLRPCLRSPSSYELSTPLAMLPCSGSLTR